MNPNDNNPMSPTGASGAAPFGGADETGSSSIPPAADFNNMGGGLSMDDSLASAQDNLTSAGQAANAPASAPGIDQLGVDNPSAAMESPVQPLTPAAPVPGSIGSVTSVPAAPAAPVDTSVLNNNVTTSAMPVMGGGNSSANTNPAPAAPTTSTQPFFNPFASGSNSSSTTSSDSDKSTTSSMPDMSKTSSTAVPPALQPQTGKFSGGFGGKKSFNVMGVLGWILAIAFAAATVVFVVLWQGAERRAEKPEIIYVDKNEGNNDDENKPDEGENGGGEVSTTTAVTCTQESGGATVEGLEGLLDTSNTMNAMFGSDGALTNIALISNYIFVDEDAANASVAYFDSESSRLATAAADLGIDQMQTSFGVSNSGAMFTKSADAAQIDGGFAGEFMLTADEAGNVDKSQAHVEQVYTDAGFVCSVAE